MNILFTCVGRRIELIQEFKKALTNDSLIIGADCSPNAPALTFCDKGVISPRISDANYILFLIETCKKHNIKLLIPTIDTDLIVLSKNVDRFSEVGTKVLVSDFEIIKKCRDKRKTEGVFSSVGLLYPNCTDDVNDYRDRFPAIIKPLDGSSSINMYKVNSADEMTLYSRLVPNYIIQPCIEGTEYTVDVLCDFFGNPIFITPRKRVLVRAGEVLVTEIDNDQTIIEEIKLLINSIKPVGPITVQLIKEDKTNKNWYIEINPRFGGGAPLSMKAGANSAKAIIELLKGNKVEFQPNIAEDHAIYSRFDQSVRIN